MTPAAAAPVVARRTRGGRAVRFLERYVRHSEGDYYGEPFRVRPWQREILDQVFELQWNERAQAWRRRRRRVLLGFPKGSGKTELLAGLGLFLLTSGEQRSPDIPIAAASKEQAGLLFGSARAMVDQSPELLELITPGVDELVLRHAPGRLYRVSAADGTNDGRRSSAFLADELHEWAETKSTYDVLSNATAKRADSLEIVISTAGWDLDSVLGRLYQRGKAIERGELVDDRFLMIWYEAPAGAAPGDPATWYSCQPALGDWISEEQIQDRYDRLPIQLFKRYWLNQWTSSESAWLPGGAWAKCRREGLMMGPGDALEDRLRALGWDPDAPTVIGWDAATRYDSTALVAVQRAGERVRVLARVWTPPAGLTADERARWTLPIEEVREYLAELRVRLKVKAIAFDPAFISWEARDLAVAGAPMVEFPQHGVRMGPASQGLYEAIVSGQLMHDGDPVLAAHLANAVARVTRGSTAWRLAKGESKRPMDAAIALAMAVDVLLKLPPEPPPKRKPLLYVSG